jgi:hypothetical protein
VANAAADASDKQYFSGCHRSFSRMLIGECILV